MAYGQEGRAGTVYQVAAGDERRALKVFKRRFSVPALVTLADRLETFSEIPGLQVCRRTVLTPRRHTELLRKYPDLTYAVLMPWITGPTWLEVLLEKTVLRQEESLTLARGLAEMFSSMEERGVAHCDLSGPNLLLPALAPQPAEAKPDDNPAHPAHNALELVDVEQLYGPGLERPEIVPGGSQGYAHRTAHQGVWESKADRLAGAVLLAEILGWCDEGVREAAWGEGYFDPQEVQGECERYRLLRDAISERWGQSLARLLDDAWESETLADCPTFGQWLVALPDSVPVAATEAFLTPHIETQPAITIDGVEIFSTNIHIAPAEQPEEVISPEVQGIIDVARRFEDQGRWNSARNSYLLAQTLAPPGSKLSSMMEGLASELEGREEATQGEVLLASAFDLPPNGRHETVEIPALPGATVAGESKVDTASLFRDGVAAFERGDWAAAREMLTEVVRREPGYKVGKKRASKALAEAEERLRGATAQPTIPTPESGVAPNKNGAGRTGEAVATPKTESSHTATLPATNPSGDKARLEKPGAVAVALASEPVVIEQTAASSLTTPLDVGSAQAIELVSEPVKQPIAAPQNGVAQDATVTALTPATATTVRVEKKRVVRTGGRSVGQYVVPVILAALLLGFGGIGAGFLMQGGSTGQGGVPPPNAITVADRTSTAARSVQLAVITAEKATGTAQARATLTAAQASTAQAQGYATGTAQKLADGNATAEAKLTSEADTQAQAQFATETAAITTTAQAMETVAALTYAGSTAQAQATTTAIEQANLQAIVGVGQTATQQALDQALATVNAYSTAQVNQAAKETRDAKAAIEAGAAATRTAQRKAQSPPTQAPQPTRPPPTSRPVPPTQPPPTAVPPTPVPPTSKPVPPTSKPVQPTQVPLQPTARPVQPQNTPVPPTVQPTTPPTAVPVIPVVPATAPPLPPTAPPPTAVPPTAIPPTIAPPTAVPPTAAPPTAPPPTAPPTHPPTALPTTPPPPTQPPTAAPEPTDEPTRVPVPEPTETKVKPPPPTTIAEP